MGQGRGDGLNIRGAKAARREQLYQRGPRVPGGGDLGGRERPRHHWNAQCMRGFDDPEIQVGSEQILRTRLNRRPGLPGGKNGACAHEHFLPHCLAHLPDGGRCVGKGGGACLIKSDFQQSDAPGAQRAGGGQKIGGPQAPRRNDDAVLFDLMQQIQHRR